MNRKNMWLLVACLMVLSLVIASCGQAQTNQTTPTAQATTTATTAPVVPAEEKRVAAPATEKPKYGGVLRIGRKDDILYFDDIVGIGYAGATLHATNEVLFSGDWARGPAGGYGTNESAWMEYDDRWELKAGYIAESWEIPTKIAGDMATVIWHIRKGVRFALNPDSEASKLVNGRELTADDVVFSLNQVITDKRSRVYTGSPELRAAKITALDKWTVKTDFPWEAFETAVGRFGDYTHIVPSEVVKKYGTMADWKVSVGTGPFMLTDFVAGSAATLVRNPNYWMRDPVGPGKGNQLPYLDGVKILIIPDASTRYAAVRTARIDWLGSIPLEDFPEIKRGAAQVKWASYMVSPQGGIAMRTDRSPFTDIRVRRAMLLAIDFETMNKQLYGGVAQPISFPYVWLREYGSALVSLDDPDTPESVKELYSYNPEKAKTLLREAGYPNGIKTWLDFGNDPRDIDYYSIYVDYWGKVGIKVDLKPKESAAAAAMTRSLTYEQMVAPATGATTATLFRMTNIRGQGESNRVRVNDPVVEAAYVKIQRLFVEDKAAAYREHRELMKYVLDQAWSIPRLATPIYTMWWPWVKNYSGEINVGYMTRHFYTWPWIDQDLKKSMGY